MFHPQKANQTRRSISLVARLKRPLIALAIGLATTGAAAPAAHACGMRTWEPELNRILSPESDQLLAQARRHLKRGEGLSAMLRAKAALDQTFASDAVKAEALAIIGWVRFHRGQIQPAFEAIARSRALKPTAIYKVLAQVQDGTDARFLRQVLHA